MKRLRITCGLATHLGLSQAEEAKEKIIYLMWEVLKSYLIA